MANIDFQLIISWLLVLKYIAKYASKVERKLEICVNMLERICSNERLEDQDLKSYQKFMVYIVVEQDIGAQGTCHMLQKLPLMICTQNFVSINVGKKVFHHLKKWKLWWDTI